MCGIAGFVGAPSEEILGAMSRCMRHRGPDDQGQIGSPWATIASRRLAIIDVAGGHQPMSTAAGKLHIAYNGEVYNFRELRDGLRGRGATFETDTDTEVVLKAYELDGPASFARLNGMFAFALLDLREEEPQLLLVRDQFGIKPLYHTTMGERLLFGSEIRTLLAAPGYYAKPNVQAVVDYLSLGLHDHDTETFFAGIRSVPAAHFLTVRPGGMKETRYWEPHLSEDGDPDPATFYDLFRRAVERRLVSEVPVGSCLSGGLDSSSIVCAVNELLREHAPDATSVGDRLKTFSAVFPGDPIDERSWIDTVLKVTRAEPHFTAPESWGLIRDLGDFTWTLEQPVVSSGPYAQWAVMKLAQGRVKVLLDGQGGDELLGGYVPYRFVYLRQLLRERRFGEILQQGISSLEVRALLHRYVRPRGQARLDPARYLRDRPSPASRLPAPRTGDDLKRRLLQDLTTYSLPSLLRYEDRISMSRSIESRVPFLDLDLVEHVLSLPADAIMRGRLSRAIFREAIKGHVPEQVRTRRKKIGFTTPEVRWLRRERHAVRGVLRSPSFLARPYWDGAAVAQAFEAMCDGRLEESLFIWRVLNTELWLRVYFDRDPADVAKAPGRDWQRIGDEAAARWLGAPAQAALAATSHRPGHHVLITEPGGTVLARIDAPRAGPALRERVRSGDVVAMRVGRTVGRVRRRVERLQRMLGTDRVGVAAVCETPAGPRVVATSGPVDPAMLAEALADDPLRAESPRVPRALIVRPVGRLPDVAVPVQAPGTTPERLPAAR